MIERFEFNDPEGFDINEEKRWNEDGYRFVFDIVKRDGNGAPQGVIRERWAILVRETEYKVWGGPMDGTPLGEFILVDPERLAVARVPNGVGMAEEPIMVIPTEDPDMPPLSLFKIK